VVGIRLMVFVVIIVATSQIAAAVLVFNSVTVKAGVITALIANLNVVSCWVNTLAVT